MLDAATALRAHGYRAEARPVLERALAWYEVRPPDEADTEDHKYGLGLVLYESGRWDEAEALFRELSAGSPTGVTYRAYLGLIAARRGDLEAAEEIDAQLAASDRPYLLGHNTYWRSRIAAVLGEPFLQDRDSSGRVGTGFTRSLTSSPWSTTRRIRSWFDRKSSRASFRSGKRWAIRPASVPRSAPPGRAPIPRPWAVPRPGFPPEGR